MKKYNHTLSSFLKKGSTWNIVKGDGLEAFTLIELMVVISIMAILLMMWFTQFAHYKTKQTVRNSSKILSQTLNDARNSAIYWMASSTWNLDIWVKLETWKWKIGIYWFPINDTISNYTSPDNKYLLEERPFENKVEFSSSWGLILYKAITWSWIYKWDFTITDNKIEMIVWLKWATTWFFSKKIKYYTKTYISDVE